MSSSTRQRQDCAKGCYAAFGRESGSSTRNNIYLRATFERAVGRRGTNGCQTIGGGQNG
jgi:hypothetical protein